MKNQATEQVFKECNFVAQWALRRWAVCSGPLLRPDRWRSPSLCQAAQTNRPAIWLTNLPLLFPLLLLHPPFSLPANSYPCVSFTRLLFSATIPFIAWPTWWHWSSGRTCWSLCPRKCHLTSVYMCSAWSLIQFPTISIKHNQLPKEEKSSLVLLHHCCWCRSALSLLTALTRTSHTYKSNGFRQVINLMWNLKVTCSLSGFQVIILIKNA